MKTTEMAVIKVDSVSVHSWSPGQPDENIPCTQVHLMVVVPGVDAKFVIRLKSRAAVDALISALIEHRDFVWPDGDK